MPFSPSLNLLKLKELKQWQGSQEILLQHSGRKSQLQPLEQNRKNRRSTSSSPSTSFHSIEKAAPSSEEWDKRKIQPAKPFQQLLEEKLAEESSIMVNDKPKRPFLRKGEGLARFRMTPTYPVKDGIKSNAMTKKGNYSSPKTPVIIQQKTPSVQKKGILKKTNPLYHQEIDLSPLEIPDFVKPRGTWKQVFGNGERVSGNLGNNYESESESLENYEEFRKSLGPEERKTEVSKNQAQPELLFKTSSSKQVSGYTSDSSDEGLNSLKAQLMRRQFDGKNPLICNDIPDNLDAIKPPQVKAPMGDLTLEDLKMQRELKIFETLEKRANNSSFGSTNASIMNLLVSTPQKDSKIVRDEPASVSVVDDSVVSKYIPESIQLKLREVSSKTNVLQQFLLNLMEADLQDKQVEKTVSASTSFSEENTRWSTRSPSLADNCTEYETGHSDSSWKKIDVGVNTSLNEPMSDETIRAAESCKDCEELSSKYFATRDKLNQLKSEHTELKSEFRELKKDNDNLRKSVKKKEEQYEEKLERLQADIDVERKKFAKEKTYFETYVKEVQNRPTKKEREEITSLKQELADAKELIKLKDSKNGATQARLRNQIKQHEKELTELRNTVDKLQKENAKLSASQKFARRPQEVKMLHEINKNLSKLTEKTLKKQLTKSSGNGDMEADASSDEELVVKSVVYADKENNTNRRAPSIPKDNQRTAPAKATKNTSISDKTLNDTPFDGVLIEQQYETTFGNIASPRNVSCSTNLEKSEKTLSDGSVEIMYSNGNLKRISADGNTIKMIYFNGDTKETYLKDKIIKYHYAVADSWHIQYPDGTEVMEFKDGHKCTKHVDGRTEVSYPDGTLRLINVDGTEEQRFPDGRKTVKNLQGEHIILLPNGQREIHTEEYKRREYPDGTIRTLHKDGTVETVYANGRVRLKDANGTLIMDTHHHS